MTKKQFILLIITVITTLIIGFYAGMRYKAYQVRTHLNNFANETLIPILDELIEEKNTKTVQYPTAEDMDELPPGYEQ